MNASRNISEYNVTGKRKSGQFCASNEGISLTRKGKRDLSGGMVPDRFFDKELLLSS
jgi:hypothetical protein